MNTDHESPYFNVLRAQGVSTLETLEAPRTVAFLNAKGGFKNLGFEEVRQVASASARRLKEAFSVK